MKFMLVYFTGQAIFEVTDLDDRLIWSVNEYFSSTGNPLLRMNISFATSLASL